MLQNTILAKIEPFFNCTQDLFSFKILMSVLNQSKALKPTKKPQNYHPLPKKTHSKRTDPIFNMKTLRTTSY